jgi:dihydroneopterin aldolase
VKSLIEASRFDLVERLATAIADTVLEMAPIDAIRVQLTKEAPPIPGFGGTVGIDITRQSPSAAGRLRPANQTEGKP